MSYWLVKSEPEEYSYADLEKETLVEWTGVRNYQARNFLKEMKEGEYVFFYHSGKERAIVGLALVAKEYFPDPSSESDRWVAVKLKPNKELKTPVSLEEFKSNPKLSENYLVKQSRLSVMPLNDQEFQEVMQLGGLDIDIL